MPKPCFWCHDVDQHGQVVLTNYLPCETCRETFEGRILCMEVDFADKLKQPDIAKTGLAPTGAHVVLEETVVSHMNLTDAQKAQALASGKIMMEPCVFQMLIKEIRKQ